MKILGLLAGAAMLLGAQAAHAATVTITNGGFEDPSGVGNFATLPAGDPGLPGWTIGGDSVTLDKGFTQGADVTSSAATNGIPADVYTTYSATDGTHDVTVHIAASATTHT